MTLSILNTVINDTTRPMDVYWQGNYRVGQGGAPGSTDTKVLIATVPAGQSQDFFGDEQSLLYLAGGTTQYNCPNFSFLAFNDATLANGTAGYLKDPAAVHARCQLIIDKILANPDSQLLPLLIKDAADTLLFAGVSLDPTVDTIVIEAKAFPDSAWKIIHDVNQVLDQPISNLEVLIQVPPTPPPEIPAGKHVAARALWWGYQIYLDETAVGTATGGAAEAIEELIEDVVEAIPEVGEIIGALLKVYFAAENAAIKAVDRGHGVTLSACWLASLLLIPSPIQM